MRRYFPAVGLLATAGLVATASHQWWLLPLGLAAAGAVTVFTSDDDHHALEGLDDAHRARARTLLAAHAAVVRQLRRTPGDVTGAVSPSRLASLAAQALRLIARHQALEVSLHSTPDDAARAERMRLDHLAHSAGDSMARSKYRQATATRDAQLADFAALRAQASQLDAEISAVHAKLDALHSQLLKLTSLHAASGLRDATDRVLDDLNALSNELGALTEAYDSLTSTNQETSR